MSETGTEQVEGTDTPDETEAPDEETTEQPDEAQPDETETETEEAIEGDDEDTSADEETEQGDEEARQAQARNEQDLEKLHGQIANANKAHVAKIGRIMGEDSLALIPCPVCSDFVDGLIFPPEVAPIPDTIKERMQQLLGLNDWEDTPTAPWAIQCPDCKGHGEVKTGSFVLGKETTRCLTCGGDGWKNTMDDGASNVVQIVPPTETGPGVYGTEIVNDPDVLALRKRGFTVIPPMQVGS